MGTNLGFTVEAWINPADVANQHPVVEWNDGRIGAHLWISVAYAGVGGPGAIYASMDNNPANVIASSPGLLTAGIWQHVAMTYRTRFMSDEVKLFLNGAEVATKAIPPTTPQTSYPLRIGQRAGLTSFRGQIDEVSLYDRALSAAEIQALYNAGSAGKCPGLFLSHPQRSGLTTTFRYPTRRDSYYIHYFGLDVTNITGPFELRFGDGLPATVSFASGSDRGFFRVGEVPLTSPLDVDQDGIDDAYELQHRTILNPLVGGDARQDPDADGDSNLYEYVCRSDPTNHFNAPFPLQWSRVNSFGILKDGGQDVWHAGRVVDVIANTSSGVLAATEHGGVWSLTHSSSAIPLSDTWDKPDMNSLAAGPDGAAHFFAAGGGLYEMDVTHAFPIFNWREIPHPLARVIKLVVLPVSRRIVLAGEAGVVWATIPPTGSPPSSYVWRAAEGLPAGSRYYGAAEGPDESVVVERKPGDTSGARLFRGTWSGGNLNFSEATINGVDQTGMYRTSLASCAGDRRFMYAISADYTNEVEQGYVYAVLRSTDGGQTWSPCGKVFEGAPAGYEFRFVPGNQGNNRNQCIAVSPTDPNRVAFGWRRGPFVSVNGGSTWRADSMVWNPANPSNPSFRTPHQHVDLAAVYFDPYDGSQNSLYVGSDGGLIRTPDLGMTLSSTYNRNLADLDFVNPSGARYWYGTLGVSLQGNDLVIGSGSQDSGNLYCYFDTGSGTPSPWLYLGGGDGNLFTFLETGDMLSWHNSDANVRWARWDPGANAFNAAGYVDVMPSYPSAAGAFHLDQAVIEAVESPSQQNSFGQLMYAVAGRAEKLYAFYADANGANCHWTPVGTLATNGGNWALNSELTLDSNTLAIDPVNNRVGIGTASPGWPLHQVAAQGVVRVDSTANTFGSVLELRNNTASPTYLGAINFNNAAASYPGQIGYTGDDALTFRTAGAERMRLDSAGRLDVTGPGSSVSLNVVDSIPPFSFFRGLKATSDSLFGTAILGISSDGTAISGASANGLAGNFSGAVQINYASPFDKPHLLLKDPADAGFARLRMQTGSRPFWDIAMGGDNSVRFYADGNGDVMVLNTNGQLYVNVLTIRGGADIAEPFQMSQRGLPKGAVVVIDEEHPGHLKLSSEPYDRRVAGIISGAGGVNPGLSLSQQGVMEGDQQVALTGRVYVQADTSNGPIKPGDLLTTSASPGHAMKVTDPQRAHGATLGKAMTRLDEGEGLVLVLVALQ